MKNLLREAASKGASDLHIVVGAPPMFRVDGELVRYGEDLLLDEDCGKLLFSLLSDKQRREFEETRDIDLSYEIKDVGRFRVNGFYERGVVGVAVRVVAKEVPSVEDLGLPSVIQTLADKSRGLVLVTGPTGSGKSTTLAAMIRYIIERKSCYILTLENPIEYLHRHGKSIISQREVSRDTTSFSVGLRAALREDPDVIMVQEMRDPETMATAITAAETGHLVLATLHTSSAAQTIDRIIDSFPAHQQEQVRIQLSVSLQGIVAQQLIPRMDKKGRIAAMEVLVANPAVRNMIRDRKSHQIDSVIQTSRKNGMMSMDESLKDLYKMRIISYQEGLERAYDADRFVKSVNQ